MIIADFFNYLLGVKVFIAESLNENNEESM